MGEERSTQGQLKGLMGKFVLALAVGTSLYHYCFVAGGFQRAGIFLYSAQHYAISLGLLLFLVFLLYPAKGAQRRDKVPWYDILLGIGALASCGYHVIFTDLAVEHLLTASPTVIEAFLALVLLLVLMEAVRRVIGIAMPILATLFIIYVFTSSQLPGLLHARAINFPQAVSIFYLSNSGIFGTVVEVYSTIIFAFVIFSSFFQVSGVGKFFINLAMSLAGSSRGGPAKVAVVASALFGTISGSTAANVATTGAFTIPLMKRIGFSPSFAGGVEAVASNGGQIMPPVMGIVAFIMAEIIGVPYIKVCVAAALPAILYYIALFVAVDLQAGKTGMKGVPREELPSFKQTLKQGWHYMIPIVALLFFLIVLRLPAEVAALYAIVIVVVVSMFRQESRIGPRRLIGGLDGAAKTMLIIGPACGLMGVILGAMNASGIGVVITGSLLSIAGGNMTFLLVMAAALCFLMGMGMGTLIIYMTLAALVAPALVQMGVPIMAAHFFIFYWGIVSLITPPVCVASFVAAGIAGSKPMETGWQATRLGIVTFIIPFAFVYSPVLLLEGSPLEIALATVTGIAGASLLSVGTIGYLFKPLTYYQRGAVILSSFLLIFPGWVTDLIGILLALVALLPQLRSAAQAGFRPEH